MDERKMLPVGIDITCRRLLVIGGGAVAAEKVVRARRFFSRITVVAAETKIEPDDTVEVIVRPYREDDIKPDDIVIAATGDEAVDGEIYEYCRARGIPVNVPDVPRLCTFYMPAVVKRGDLTVAISTGGKSPAYAARLRREIEALIPENIDEVLNEMGRLRERVSREVGGQQERKKIYERRLAELLGESASDIGVSETEGDSGLAHGGDDIGSVTLVGAGCAAGLITQRGLEAVRRAEVLIYDDLIDAALCDEALEGAERIYAGKRQGHHSKSQQEINELIIERASAGLRVVRLKGGDPFVFGRGGEEYLAVCAAGIPCEVIPGVSSATAVPGLAGIPVTHRGVADSFTVVTGHRGADGESETDYKALAALSGTLVFLMGRSRAAEIAERLIYYGKSPDTPTAAVSVRVGGDVDDGSREESGLADGAEAARVASDTDSINDVLRADGTLAELAQLAESVPDPAVLVVGDVVTVLDMDGEAVQPRPTEPQTAYPTHLTHPTSHILVTGTHSFTERLTERLSREGISTRAEVTLAAVELPEAYPAVLDGYDWLVFTSANGVEFFIGWLRREHIDIRSLSGLRIAVIGSGTAERLSENGLYADLMPEEYTAAALGQMLADRVGRGERVLILRSEDGSLALTDAFADADIYYEDRAIYRCVAAGQRPNSTHKISPSPNDSTISAIIFGSASGVRVYFEIHGSLPDGARPVCIGGYTADELRRHTDIPPIIAHSHSTDGIVEAVRAIDVSTL